ncbi:hypothetical protein C8R44DRAFT_737521 [Mycena epipterygia]|nr:hypothetical protein C8R44DRAFT_737521 [Mycena epipterygia]
MTQLAKQISVFDFPRRLTAKQISMFHFRRSGGVINVSNNKSQINCPADCTGHGRGDGGVHDVRLAVRHGAQPRVLRVDPRHNYAKGPALRRGLGSGAAGRRGRVLSMRRRGRGLRRTWEAGESEGEKSRKVATGGDGDAAGEGFEEGEDWVGGGGGNSEGVGKDGE